MNDQKETDHEQEKRHFQSINAANVTNTVSTLLTLAVGVAAFAVNILVNSQGPLDHCAGKWLVASLGLLLLSAFVGIIIFFIRIEDYKRTIEGIVMQRNHPGEVSLEVARAARSLKKTADVLNAPGEFRAKVVSTIDPDVLAPLLLRSGRNLLNEFSFQDSPRIELTAEGKSLWDLTTMQARGRVEVAKAKFRGVPLLKASCDVEFKNQLLSFRKINVEREEGHVTADNISYDLAHYELRIDNGRSNCVPNDVMMWIDPGWLKWTRPYRWKKPPVVKVDGVVQFHGRMNTRLTIDFDAPAGMDYTFAKRPLFINKFSGQLLFTEHRLQLNNLRGDLFEGRWRASADIPVNRPGVAYSSKIEVDDADFQALAKTYFGLSSSQGRLAAHYDFTGRGDEAGALVGTGAARVDKGNVFAIPVFGPLSALMSKAAPGLGYDKANQASADFATKDGRVETKNFLVKGAG